MKHTKLHDILELCRPQHAIKNLLILFPPLFGKQLFHWDNLVPGISSLLSFSFIASAVYVFNDLIDCEKDRQHPIKQKRVFPSGRLSSSFGWVLFVVLSLVGFDITFFSKTTFLSLILAIVYLLINLLYSLKLKNEAIIDIIILSSGFVIRVYYGGVWFNVAISPWLFLCVLNGALCFALGKRRNEMIAANGNYASRPVLGKYSLSFLTASYYLFCGISIVFFSLWTVFLPHQNMLLQFSIPVVIMIMLRYNHLIETRAEAGDPVVTLLKDWILLSLAMIFLIMSTLGVYLT